MALPFPTKNDLPEPAREKVIALLSSRLADAFDLQAQAKHAHWNVKGPSFFQLHELFDKITEDVEDYVDDLAERIVQLGGIADGTLAGSAKKSSLPAYPEGARSGHDHLVAVAAALAGFAKAVRADIDHADHAGDKDTADLFTEISRGADKWLWFVEAHLHADK
jgi:starvation-inducible DNA-binding protein